MYEWPLISTLITRRARHSLKRSAESASMCAHVWEAHKGRVHNQKSNSFWFSPLCLHQFSQICKKCPLNTEESALKAFLKILSYKLVSGNPCECLDSAHCCPVPLNLMREFREAFESAWCLWSHRNHSCFTEFLVGILLNTILQADMRETVSFLMSFDYHHIWLWLRIELDITDTLIVSFPVKSIFNCLEIMLSKLFSPLFHLLKFL